MTPTVVLQLAMGSAQARLEAPTVRPTVTGVPTRATAAHNAATAHRDRARLVEVFDAETRSCRGPVTSTNDRGYTGRVGLAATATMSETPVADAEPLKTASPKAKTPPVLLTREYPPESAVAAMPTTLATCTAEAGRDPWYAASPKPKTPPSDPTSQ